MKIRRFYSNCILALALAAFVCPAGAASAAGRDNVPQQVFEAMRAGFRPDRARGVHVRYQFNLSGPDGGEWWVKIDDGKFHLGRGKIDHPDVTFIASDKDWVALSNGTLSGTWATLTGRLKVHGNQWLARKLDEMCP